MLKSNFFQKKQKYLKRSFGINIQTLVIRYYEKQLNSQSMGRLNKRKIA